MTDPANKDVVGEAISRHPCNTSTTKQMYSFSKADRFPRQRPYGEHRFYDLPPVLSNRKTTFGYGERSDFTKGIKSFKLPPKEGGEEEQKAPEKKERTGPAYSFPSGRQVPKLGMNNKYPGPGDYDIVKPFGSDARKFTMRGRNENFKKANEIVFKNDKVPEPLKNIHAIVPSGKYVLSSIGNVHSLGFDQDRVPRFVYGSKIILYNIII